MREMRRSFKPHLSTSTFEHFDSLRESRESKCEGPSSAKSKHFEEEFLTPRRDDLAGTSLSHTEVRPK
eukprot:389520-Prorocentrum_minimum.AAC.1